MLVRIFMILSVFSGFTLPVEAEDKVGPRANNRPQVESLKQVNNICLGYIDGSNLFVERFKRYLTEFLIQKGFTLTEDTSACDAILIGQVNAVEEWEVYCKHIIAETSMKLITSDFKVLWSGAYAPSLRYFVDPHNGLKNRARQVATGISKSKQKE